jgi:hypothetical protein
MDGQARSYINQPCHVMKITKAGLVHVSLDADPKQCYSFPKRCIEMKD